MSALSLVTSTAGSTEMPTSALCRAIEPNVAWNGESGQVDRHSPTCVRTPTWCRGHSDTR